LGNQTGQVTGGKEEVGRIVHCGNEGFTLMKKYNIKLDQNRVFTSTGEGKKNSHALKSESFTHANKWVKIKKKGKKKL